MTAAITTSCPACGAALPALGAVKCAECGWQRALADTGVNSARGVADSTQVLTGGRSRPRPVEVVSDDPLIGRTLHVYHLISLLGQGAMGRVYLAQHTQLRRGCAVKILSPVLAREDPAYLSRFQNEGRAAASLVHPNIVTIHAIGESEGWHYLEMEFVAGRSLQQLIASEGRLEPVRSTSIAVRIAEGLAAAHRGHIVHRDLKPDNVLLTHQGIPKIADFGLAKRLTGEAGLEGLLGTPSFMAPELFHGQSTSPASDVYALGVVYFIMLTGRPPFVAETLTQLMSQIATAPLPPVREFCPGLPLEMAECLSLMLAKDPAQRPRDGTEAAQLLHAVLGQVRDLDSLLEEAFSSDPQVRWSRQNDRYELDYQFPDGRRQTLFLEPSGRGSAERLLMIYSICCDAAPEYYEFALRLNAEIPHGGLAVREINGRARFIMADTYPRATVDAEEVRRSVIEVAFRADAVEKLLTGLDQH